LGKAGKVVNPLRPAGVVEFADGERLDVVSEGAYIAGGDEVIVVKVEGRRIVVRKKDE
jgi:membrane-bound serine protease (ClpP class)